MNRSSSNIADDLTIDEFFLYLLLISFIIIVTGAFSAIFMFLKSRQEPPAYTFQWQYDPSSVFPGQPNYEKNVYAYY